MAVYKPTLCHPFGGGLDIRTAPRGTAADGVVVDPYSTPRPADPLSGWEAPIGYLSCRVETSNVPITGYSVSLYTANHERLFPDEDWTQSGAPYISPLSEIQDTVIGRQMGYEPGATGGINSGENGSILKIPFFRPWAMRGVTDSTKGYQSYNAIYYRGRFVVHHILLDLDMMHTTPYAPPAQLQYTQSALENAENWSYQDSGSDVGFSIFSGTLSSTTSWTIDQEPVIPGDLVGVLYHDSARQASDGGIYQVRPLASDSEKLGLYKLTPWNENCEIVTVWQGQVQHGTNWFIYQGRGSYDPPGEVHPALWWSSTGQDEYDIPLNALGTQYQWEVTLYQGKQPNGDLPIVVSTASGQYIDASTIADLWWDNTVTAGQILGSNSERVQLADVAEQYLPRGTDADPLVLQDTFCATYAALATDDDNPTIAQPDPPANIDTKAGYSRFHVASHSLTLGHVYPAADATVNLGNYCAFYEHSQDPTQILDTDIVDYVFTQNQTGLVMGALVDGYWTEYSSESDWYKVSVTDRYWACPDTWTQTGLVLLQHQSNPRQNGVWQVQALTASSNIYSWIETASTPAREELVPGWLTTLVDPSFYSASWEYGGAGYVIPGIASSTLGYRGWGYIKTPTDVQSPNQIPLPSGQYRYYLRRAAGYNSWASYIGRVIYARSPIGGNYTSLANASGATLWDPNSLTGQYGQGRLWIVPERPILLFRNKLKTAGDFLGSVCVLDASASFTAGTQNVPSGPLSHYRAYWQPGEYIADRTGSVFLIEQFREADNTTTPPTPATWTLSQVASVSVGEYLWVSRLYWTGGSVLQYDDSRAQAVYKRTGDTAWARSWDLHQAKVLKNSATKTYISPWADGAINSRMVLELQSPGSVNVVESTTTRPTTKVHITGQNDVTYSITHPQLSTAMPSLVDPWTHEIKSFFRTSDPNPFFSYEAPYLRLNASGVLLATTLQTDKKWVKLLYRGKNGSTEIFNYSAWPLNEESSDDPMPYLTQKWETLPSLGTRYWHLCAYYPPLSGGHWTAYQWRLQDAAGKLLQDSGRRYDGLIDAIFAGLANDARDDTVYYADLTVENTFNDVLHYSIKFAIGANTGQYSDGIRDERPESFSAHWDCPNQAMILSYSYPARADSNYARYSIYRREYGIFIDPTYTPIEPEYAYPAGHYRSFVGPWEPVLLQCPANPAGTGNTPDEIRDFNVVNGKTYQYVVYPADADPNAEPAATEQVFANYLGNVWHIEDDGAAGRMISGTAIDSKYYGSPEAVTGAECWSMVELEPVEYDPYIPLVRGAYRVNNDNIWLFRFNVETGEQMQNLGRSEFQSLGQYARFGYGRMNHISGSVSAQLGSEIVCSSKYKYIERLPKARIEPLSTNEKAEMLLQWRRFMASRNPKLLRDIKGQSWIVQVMGPSNTPRNYYPNTPDTVSFQWKAIGDPRNVIIYGTYDQIQQQIAEALHSAEWPTAFGNAPTGSPVAEWVHQDGQGLWIYRQDTDTYVTQDGTELTFDIPNNNT